MIQAVLFDKTKYTEEEAMQFLRHHKLRPIKPVHITEHKLRYRLALPHFQHYITKRAQEGVEYVIGF